jgi:type II secretion system protein C
VALQMRDALLLLLVLAPGPPPTPLAAPAAVSSPAPQDLAVAGVVVGSAPERSSAILTSGGRTRVVAVGESAFGARLVSVTADAVVLEREGERRELRLPAVAASALPRPAGATSRPLLPPGTPPEDPETPAREMNRVEVQRRLGEEIPRILAETALAPVMEEGRVVGVQVTRLPEGSLLTDAGLRAGDVLRRINDTDIDGMATLIGLWPRLQAASELRAVVVRNGQPFSILVSLR